MASVSRPGVFARLTGESGMPGAGTASGLAGLSSPAGTASGPDQQRLPGRMALPEPGDPGEPDRAQDCGQHPRAEAPGDDEAGEDQQQGPDHLRPPSSRSRHCARCRV